MILQTIDSLQGNGEDSRQRQDGIEIHEWPPRVRVA